MFCVSNDSLRYLLWDSLSKSLGELLLELLWDSLWESLKSVYKDVEYVLCV